MAQIVRYYVNATNGTFVYPETGLPSVVTPRTAESTQEAAALAADLDIMDDQCDPLIVEGISACVTRMRDALLAAWPSCEPMDVHTLFVKNGKRISIPSFRERLLGDLQLAVSWQIGHADQAMTIAGDELIAAYRESDGTEIALERIDQAETRIGQAEARRRLWREVLDGIEAPWTYPIVDTCSVYAMRQSIAGAFRFLYDLCGEPSKTFISHRLVWAIARMAERAMLNCGNRREKASSPHAIRMIEAQDRAMQMLHEIAVAHYETATGDRYASNTHAAGIVLADAHHRVADWIESRRSRALAFAR